MQNAKVYDNIALDQSLLYPSSQPPIPFDNQPPAVTFAVSFVAEDGAVLSPVGANHLVAGTLTITADAIDPSGVQALSLAVNGSPLTAAAQGNTASHFSGTWVTGADGR